MSSHTRGPWHLTPYGDDKPCARCGGRSHYESIFSDESDADPDADPVSITFVGDEPVLAIHKDDAHLIAAAPDLLEAAKAAQRALNSVPAFTHHEGRGEAVAKLLDAIDKAEGRS